MRMSSLLGKRLKEDPKDAQMVSHKYLIRGGYIRQLSAGTYSFLPLGQRVKEKIENIIRGYMDAAGGQEVSMPVVHPAELWKETGRYDSIDASLLRFVDRAGKENVLAMTHEEAAVHLVRNDISSYKQLPFMIYQIQTKFRDEARSRGGLIRVREFTMKDAYSFHADEKDLEGFYSVMHVAYEHIFKKTGLKNFISVKSDSGIMGGGVSHEFMALNEMGEDTLILCEACGYKANKEIAQCAMPHSASGTCDELARVHTPGKKTIDEVAAFLNVSAAESAKSVFYTFNGALILVLIRGDKDVNETKLRNYLGIGELRPAGDEDIISAGSVPGYASPLGMNPDDVRTIVDQSIDGYGCYVCGANEPDHHLTGFCPSRDLKTDFETADLYTVENGDPCPQCGKPLSVTRGIEIGNIFQLGTKYSAPMNAAYLDETGRARDLIMASYGIGVGRLISTVIEDNHDDYGPIWPITVSPYEVHLNALKIKDESVKKTAEQLYKDLSARGIEVLFDDRNESPGSQFSEADLIGIPLRVVISKKNIDNGVAEFKHRGGETSHMVPLDECVAFIAGKISDEYKKYQA